MELPFNLGLPEMVIIFVIALFLFGPRLIPAIGRGLAETNRVSTGNQMQADVVLAVSLLVAMIAVIVRLLQIFS